MNKSRKKRKKQNKAQNNIEVSLKRISGVKTCSKKKNERQEKVSNLVQRI